MTPEPPVTLPFTEALERLCDRELARNLLDADQRLRKFQAQQANAGGSDVSVSSGAKSITAEISRVEWNRTVASIAFRSDLAARGRRGEFYLRGRQRSAAPSDPATVLSVERAQTIAINPVFSTIELDGEIYDDVEAVLGPVPVEGGAEPRRLPLLQALSHWCSPRTLLNIRRSEAYLRTDEIRALGYPALGGASRDTGSEQRLSEHQQAEVQRILEACWAELGKDLQSRIAGGEVYLTGVQTRPAAMTTQQLIPTAWAFDLQFNFNVLSVAAHGHRWTAVECWLDPPNIVTEPAEQAGPDEATPASPATLRPEDVPGLTDEAILTLLEEHAKRVVEGPDAKLIEPGKISLMPIVKRKMGHRAAQGRLLPKLVDEAEVLADWIRSKIASHPVPKAPTISKVLGKTYEALKARSTAANQNSAD